MDTEGAQVCIFAEALSSSGALPYGEGNTLLTDRDSVWTGLGILSYIHLYTQQTFSDDAKALWWALGP